MADYSFRPRPGVRTEWIRYRLKNLRARGEFTRAGVAGAYLPRIRLDVPHLVQHGTALSVPTCASMVLAHHGVEMSADYLASVLHSGDEEGTPGERLRVLQAWGIPAEFPSDLQFFRDGTIEVNRRLGLSGALLVYCWEEMWLRYVTSCLRTGNPPILFVDLGRLNPAWRGLSQPHAIVLTGGDGRQAWLNDPARSFGPVRVGLSSLMDSLLPGEPLAAVLRPNSLVRSLEQETEGGR
jgi:hypothetical protein